MTLDELQTDLLAWFSRQRPRSPVAPDARSLRDPRQRDHAAADAGLARDRALDGLARALADGRGARRGEHGRRRARVVRPRLQPPRDQPPARRARGRRARGVPAHARRSCERCPGIGPYTASAIACFAFDAQLTTVDVNVRRVLARALGRDDAPPPTGPRLGVEPGALRPRARRSASRASRAASAARSPRAVPRAACASSRCASRGRSRARRAHAGPRSCASCTTGRARRRTTMRRRSKASSATGCVILRDGLVALPEEVSR